MAIAIETPVLISPDQLQALQAREPVVIIDTRDAEAYARGHIEGAVNLREVFTFLASSSPEGLQALRDTFMQALGEAGLSGQETAVFYEDALHSGYGQSCRGYYLLTWLGYPRVRVLNGGSRPGRPPACRSPPRPAARARRAPTDLRPADVMVTLQEVRAALGTPTVLLDVRDVDEWIGDSSSPYGRDFAPRKGRCRARAGSSGTAS
jgi:thiosulfate/3-mercaptopyruvate sulfurtransferase